MCAQKSQHSISIIIPTLNGEKTLAEFFAALGRQTIQPDEILVGDSSSTDRTVEICRNGGAKIFPIERAEFDHGGTRTFLAKQAKGDVVVFFTQDAILATRNSLELLVDALFKDATIACSYGRQLAASNATPVASHLRLFNYPAKSTIRGFDDRVRYGFKTIFISNSFAAYKKDRLKDVDYFKNGLIFGEDTCTLGRLLAEGHRVAYAGETAVYHSHNYSMIDEFRRSFDIGVLHNSEKWLLETYGSAEKIGASYIRSVFEKLFREKKYLLLADCFLRSSIKFAGYKLGRSYNQMPAFLPPMLSLNSLWWKK